MEPFYSWGFKENLFLCHRNFYSCLRYLWLNLSGGNEGTIIHQKQSHRGVDGKFNHSFPLCCFDSLRLLAVGDDISCLELQVSMSRHGCWMEKQMAAQDGSTRPQRKTDNMFIGSHWLTGGRELKGLIISYSPISSLSMESDWVITQS